MNGDYTKVALRRDERWTGARMQEGRVLLDHEWNLNLDAAATATQNLAANAIGAAGVVAGSDAFRIDVTTASGTFDLTVAPGRMWVDGLAAFAPAPLHYLGQDQIVALPTEGRALVYLDVFDEHIQPAEDPLELVDPALAPIDTAARTRVGYRVRVAPTEELTCSTAWEGLVNAGQSTGRLDITRTGVITASDPCDPPGDPLAQVPDGLFRVEVLDGGTESDARFAWSFEDGGTAITVVLMAGNTVTLAPATASLSIGDLVEVSWLARRADRAPHGALYSIANVAAAPGGDVLTLDRAVAAPAGATGLAVRRWDGDFVGADGGGRAASFHGADLGVRFTAGPGEYEAGDWWGARLRAETGDGIEHRTAAEPDGIRHAFAPLALVDLDGPAVLSDCRPKFTPLADLDFDRGCCTVSVKPGDDLQKAADALPAGGGELCFAAGTYPLLQPLSIVKRSRIVLQGAGPATILRASKREAAVVFDTCSEVEVHNMRVEGGSVGSAPGEAHLEGALTFLSCTDVKVADCVLTCPDSSGKAQTCLTVRGGTGGNPNRIIVERNRVEVGAAQAGVLVIDSAQTTIDANHVLLGAAPPNQFLAPSFALSRELTQRVRAAVRPEGTAGAVTVQVPGVADPLTVVAGKDTLPLIRDFASNTSAATVRKAGGAEKALQSHVAALGAGENLETLSAASRSILAAAAATLRSAGQGIVVAGSSVGDVRIRDNVVEGAIQGIHVGVSQATKGGREAADSVLIARNGVNAVVPANYDRERHGIFVGNARSIHVLDTIGTLRRLGKASGDASPTPVEGIRIHGEIGPFLAVRHSSLRGFTVGVRVVPVGSVPDSRMWLVAETHATGAGTALNAPASVDRERNVP